MSEVFGCGSIQAGGAPSSPQFDHLSRRMGNVRLGCPPRGIESLAQPFVERGQEVAVAVEGELNGRVPEALLDFLGVRSLDVSVQFRVIGADRPLQTDVRRTNVRGGAQHSWVPEELNTWRSITTQFPWSRKRCTTTIRTAKKARRSRRKIELTLTQFRLTELCVKSAYIKLARGENGNALNRI